MEGCSGRSKCPLLRVHSNFEGVCYPGKQTGLGLGLGLA